MHLKDEYSYNYVVTKVVSLSPSIVEVSLLPVSGRLLHKSGQYCRVVFSNGNKRFYSIINHPNKSGTINLHLRIGEKSPKSLQELTRVGNTLKITGPHGSMHKMILLNQPRVLLAEGIGISAFQALMKEFKNQDFENQIVWIRDKRDVLFSDYLLYTWGEERYPIKVHLLEKCASSLQKSLFKCQKIINQHPNITMGFAGNYSTSKLIQDEFLPLYNRKNLIYMCDM